MSMAVALTRCLCISDWSLMHCPKVSSELKLSSLSNTPWFGACSKPGYERNLNLSADSHNNRMRTKLWLLGRLGPHKSCLTLFSSIFFLSSYGYVATQAISSGNWLVLKNIFSRLAFGWPFTIRWQESQGWNSFHWDDWKKEYNCSVRCMQSLDRKICLLHWTFLKANFEVTDLGKWKHQFWHLKVNC